MGEWEATPKVSYILSAAFASLLVSPVINLSLLLQPGHQGTCLSVILAFGR